MGNAAAPKLSKGAIRAIIQRLQNKQVRQQKALDETTAELTHWTEVLETS